MIDTTSIQLGGMINYGGIFKYIAHSNRFVTVVYKLTKAKSGEDSRYNHQGKLHICTNVFLAIHTCLSSINIHPENYKF